MLLLLAALAAGEGRAQDTLPAPLPSAEEEEQVAVAPPRDWAVSTARMLGAAGSVRDRAWNLQRTADKVRETGRMGHMNALASDAQELDRAVAGAVLAAEVLQRQVAAEDG